MRTQIGAVAIALGSIALGCNAAPATGTFAGPVVGPGEGVDTVVGLTVDEEGGRAYVCGGLSTFASHHAWVPLARTEGGLSGEAQGFRLDLEDNGEGYAGTMLDLSGESFDLAVDPGDDLVGPYRADLDALLEADPDVDVPVDIAEIAGAVVFEAGGDLQLQGVFKLNAIPAQVVPVGQIALQGGSIPVRTATEPFLEFRVSPAAP